MAVQNSLVQQVNKPTFSAFLTKDAVKQKINEVIGGKDGQRFMTQILSAVTANPALQECEQMSILNCAFLGESLKLSPSPQLGQYYMIPFQKKDNEGNVLSSNATFVLGVKGYKQLAMRTGQYLDIDALEIREGEYKGRDPETGKPLFRFIEDDDERESLPIIGYLAYFELLNGFKKRIYWSKAKMEKHADTYSSAFNLSTYKLLQQGKIAQKYMWKYSSFWYKNFDEMAKKTVLRNIISQWGIMSIEMQSAIEKDMVATDSAGNVNYVDNDSYPDIDSPIVVNPEPEPEQPPQPEPQPQATPQADDFFQQ